ncbi:hypothetical protein C8R47DRAFT_1102702 [Mycena vitilis]|nr:hypothetical protein C8R47DRAFT_1102702 [Mycena vitilis]
MRLLAGCGSILFLLANIFFPFLIAALLGLCCSPGPSFLFVSLSRSPRASVAATGARPRHTAPYFPSSRCPSFSSSAKSSATNHRHRGQYAGSIRTVTYYCAASGDPLPLCSPSSSHPLCACTSSPSLMSRHIRASQCFLAYCVMLLKEEEVSSEQEHSRVCI